MLGKIGVAIERETHIEDCVMNIAGEEDQKDSMLAESCTANASLEGIPLSILKREREMPSKKKKNMLCIFLVYKCVYPKKKKRKASIWR